MQFWFIENGEKQGPFEDYEIRSMIREGRVKSSTRVWFKDAESWVEASEVHLLNGEFQVSSDEVEKSVDEILPPTPFLMWRRFGARWFDHLIYQTILIIGLRLGGVPIFPDPNNPPSGVMIVGLLLPVIIMEGALVSSLGVTPGKWLLNLQVMTNTGRLLTTGQAMIRSMRVWVLGMGMREPFILILGHLFNLWIVKKKGAPLWDLTSDFRVVGSPLPKSRLIIFWFAVFALFMFFTILVYPEAQEFSEAWQEAQGK